MVEKTVEPGKGGAEMGAGNPRNTYDAGKDSAVTLVIITGKAGLGER